MSLKEDSNFIEKFLEDNGADNQFDTALQNIYEKADFDCPNCGKVYSDSDEKYLKRINKNKCGYTKQKCECGCVIGVAYNFKGDIISFNYKHVMEDIKGDKLFS